ncbi:MAG: glutaminyl-peptide cyclotransferase [Chloroflexi bacterium]|nr:glutaminyl-peptide cyclotransferase [Chloroflexota bacterium]
MSKSSSLISLLAGLHLLAGCAGILTPAAPSPLTPTLPATAPPKPEVEPLAVQVLSLRPHDTSAFTQGLLLHNGLFYESTGLVGQSSLREVDPETGEVLRRVDVPEVFAEGLALVDQRLLQLTWTSGVAFVYDLETFARRGSFAYHGEGWGLCYDGHQLYMSDGSDTLFVRDAETFAVLDTVPVRLNGVALTQLNELECVGDAIYANVWQTDEIVRIDKHSGVVTGLIDARGLLTEQEQQDADVLNGIAYDAENAVFFITGKLWPHVFEVRFVPPDEAASGLWPPDSESVEGRVIRQPA